MEKKENWINDALRKEVEFSKSSISEEFISQLKMIPKNVKQLSWKEITWMAASVALLISLNFSMIKSKSSNESSHSEQVYDSYFSQINPLNK